MAYNLTIHSQVETNTNIGNVSLGVDDILPLLRTTTASGVDLYGDDVLALDCDLGAQVKIDEIRYYFTTPTDSGTVQSTVGLYYKYDDADVYTSLFTFIGPGYYYGTITSGTSAPRYIRVVHTISGTAISGTVNGFEVTNDDDIVDFGPNGQQEAENFDIDLRYDPSEIREVEVYNDGENMAHVHVILEPQGTIADEVLTISTTNEGPWVGPKQTDNEIAGPNTWDQGTLSAAADISFDDRLQIVPGQHSCQYTTRIFGTVDTQKFTFLNLDAYYPTSSSGTIFEDDFSEGQSGATNIWELEEGSVDYTNFYMLHDLGVTTRVTTYEEFNYGSDWYMEFEFTNDASPDIGGGQTRVYPIYNNGSPGEFMIIAGYWSTTAHVNGVNLGNIHEGNTGGNSNRWISVKARREFFTFKIKAWWRDFEAEPVGWDLTHDLDRDEMAETGRFSPWSPHNGESARYDNILIQTNISTQVDTPGLVAVSGTDTRETVEIRSTNRPPLDFISYRQYWDNAPGVRWSDRLLYDDSFIRTYTVDAESHRSDKSTSIKIHIDRDKQVSWNYLYYFPTNWARPGVWIQKYDWDGNLLNSIIYQTGGAGSITSAADCFFLKSDLAQNIWTYIYSPASQGEFSDGVGYYLFRYDSDLTQTYKLYDPAKFIYDMDIIYNTGQLWYTNYETSAAVKVDTNGDILNSYGFTDEVRGIATDVDGGCWVIQLAKIYHLSSDAELLSIIDLTDIATSLSRIALSGADALWITDGWYIRRLFTDGRVNFSIEFEAQPIELMPYETGVAVMLTDRSWHFVSTDQEKVIKTIENDTGFFAGIGVDGGAYDSSLYATECPVVADTEWNALPWNIVSVNDYNVPDNQYHQVRLTLRDSNGNYLSPLVNGLYLNESILKQDIQPGNYTTIYMKADTAGQTETGNFTSNLKAWWYIDN